MAKTKDTRVTYRHEPIEVNGTFVHFNGKGNPDTKELRIYEMYGDVKLFSEAVQNFCIDNKYETCTIKTVLYF
jgi:hypothetical protein